VAAESSCSLRLGESVGAVRAVHFGRTEGGGSGAVPPCQLRALYHYFDGSGFAEAFRRWEDDVRQIELFAEHIIAEAFR
jgi:hypothetical protein